MELGQSASLPGLASNNAVTCANDDMRAEYVAPSDLDNLLGAKLSEPCDDSQDVKNEVSLVLAPAGRTCEENTTSAAKPEQTVALKAEAVEEPQNLIKPAPASPTK